MRISELSRTTGYSIPTIKFYLREGLLPPGRRTAPNQAVYEDSHLRRLRLIRVLTDVGGLNLAAIRRVLEALESESLSLHELLGVAHRALAPDAVEVETTIRAEIDAWLAARGWMVGQDAPARDSLAAAMAALRGLGWSAGPEIFDPYAEHAEAMARYEIAHVAAAPTPDAAIEGTVIGTVIFERILVALRRLAQEHHSARELDRQADDARA